MCWVEFWVSEWWIVALHRFWIYRVIVGLENTVSSSVHCCVPVDFPPWALRCSLFFPPICPLHHFHHVTPLSPNFWCFTIYCPQCVCEKQLHILKVSKWLQRGCDSHVCGAELGKKAFPFFLHWLLCREYYEGDHVMWRGNHGDGSQPFGWTTDEASRSWPGRS